MKDAPNLYASMMTMAALAPSGVEFTIAGLKQDHLLKAHELASLLNEMGGNVEVGNSVITIAGGQELRPKTQYQDIIHGRNAMAVAIIAGEHGGTIIKHLEKLTMKEYGDSFGEDMEKFGLTIRKSTFAGIVRQNTSPTLSLN